jgi:cadmium resistance protein CadD (predicted permease)
MAKLALGIYLSSILKLLNTKKLEVFIYIFMYLFIVYVHSCHLALMKLRRQLGEVVSSFHHWVLGIVLRVELMLSGFVASSFPL